MNNNSTDEQADASARRSSGYRLLAVGIILSPFIWLLVKALLGSPEDTSGLGKVIGLVLYIIPSLVSIFCIPLGIARLFDASKLTSLQQDNANDLLDAKDNSDRIAEICLIILLSGMALAGFIYFIWLVIG